MSGRPQDVWKSSAAARPPGTPRGRAKGGAGRWFAAALVVVALGGTIAGLLLYLWPDPPPLILAIPVTAYDQSDWPPNPWADADASALLQRERSPNDGAQAFQAQDRQAILRELDRAADDARKRPLVVYLSALGVPVGGKVYLIPGGGRPDDPSTWLALDDVISRLRRATSPRLLILDVRPTTDPRAVLTGEDVNKLLDDSLDALTKSGELPFSVLTANTPPEGANVLRPVRRTAFGLALAQGAGGGADGWNPERKRNGFVSARELGTYTRELTHTISVAAGFPPQAPQLYGTGNDFDLFQVPRNGPPPLPALVDPEPYPDWLQAAWQDREKWVADGLHVRAPRVVRHLTLEATRAERRWLAGGNADAIRDSFNSKANRLREVRPTLTPVVQPVGSVTRAERKPGLNVEAASSALRPVFNLILEAPGPERDKKLPDAMQAAWAKPGDTEPFDAVAVAVLNFVQDLKKPSHDQMKQLAALLNGFRPRPPRHAELLTIALIGGLPQERVERWPPETIATLVRVARDAEEAAAIDGRCLPWIADRLAKADETRRKAVRDLSDPRSTDRIRTAAVVELEAVGKDYQAVREGAGALTSAFREYEETRAVLVDLAVAYPLEALPGSEVLATTWDRLADDFGKVQQLLRAPSEPRLPDVAELGTAGQNLRAGREQLRAALRVPDTASVRQFESLLRWPHWSPTDRTKLLARLAETERAATRKVLDGWPKEPPNRDVVPPSKDASRVGSNAVRDLRRAVALLLLVEAPDAADLKVQVDRLGTNPAAVAELAPKVRLAARRRLAEAYVAADPALQALIGWAVDPDDVPAFPQPGSAGPPNPEPAERLNAERVFHEWLVARRYTADATLFGASEVKAVQDAANGSRDIARAYGEAFR